MTDPDRRRYGVAFWTALLVGGAIALVGVRSFLDTYADASRRVSFAKWVAGVDVVHDVVIAPVAIAAGVLARRLVPARWWRPVQSGLFASAVVLLLAWRPLTHSGSGKHNVSIQPLDYRTATATALGVVWFAVLLWCALRWRAGRRDRPLRAGS
jgi:hypothetical protein